MFFLLGELFSLLKHLSGMVYERTCPSRKVSRSNFLNGITTICPVWLWYDERLLTKAPKRRCEGWMNCRYSFIYISISIMLFDLYVNQLRRYYLYFLCLIIRSYSISGWSSSGRICGSWSNQCSWDFDGLFFSCFYYKT